MRREIEIEKDCLTYLNKNGWYAWKNATVGVYDEKAKAYRKPTAFQLTGVSDCIAINDDGVVIFVEFKNDRGVQSKDQINFQAQIAKRNGHYILAKSVEQLKEHLDVIIQKIRRVA